MIVYTCMKWFFRIYFSWPLYVDIVRHDHTAEKGKIFAANHPTTLDPIILILALKERVSALIAQSVFNIPLIGLLLHKSGHIPVIENQGIIAYNAALKKLMNGENILIFPEGGLSELDGSTNNPFSGAVRLSLEAQVPLIPVGISFSKDKLYQKKLVIKEKIESARFYLFGRYNITVGKPLYFSGKVTDFLVVKSCKISLMKQINSLAEESAIRLFSR